MSVLWLTFELRGRRQDFDFMTIVIEFYFFKLNYKFAHIRKHS